MDRDYITITSTLRIPKKDLRFQCIHASGPGGQNVNKVATAVKLRFDVRQSPHLAPDVRDRLERLAGRRITANGILLIDSRRFRTQEENRRDAINKLVELVRQAMIRPKKRRKTAPTLSSTKNRLQSKLRRGAVKGLRRTRHVVVD